MSSRSSVPALLAGLTISAAFVGCGQPADQTAPVGGPSGTATSTPPTSSVPSTPATDAGKGSMEAPAPATGAGAPAVIDKPASPTPTPADAAKDKGKASEGEVKKETAPKGA